MVKPTVLQKVLNRPSQTYSFPQEKVYFSAKHEIARAVAETQGRSQAHASIVPNVVERSIRVKPMDDVPALSERSQPQPISGSGATFDNNGDPDDEEDSDSDNDAFYTPNASPRTSMASTMIPSYRPPSPAETRVLATKTSLSHANLSTTSISSSALDAHSLFSDIMSESESTHVTTPLQSDTGHGAKSNPRTKANGYAKQEWAKDVRWLVPTPAVRSTTTPKAKPPQKTDEKPPSAPMTKPSTRSKPNTPISKNVSKTTPSIMTSMAALLEDDELQSLTYVTNRQPRSAVLISPPKQPHRNAPPPPASRPRMPSGPSPSTASSSSTSRPKHPSPLGTSSTVSRRRSRSLGQNEFTYGSSKTPSSVGHGSTTSYASSHTTSSQRTSRTGKYASSSGDPYDATNTSLPTFTPGSLPSQGTPGYTSLVLPRAPVPLSQKSNPSKGILGLGAALGKELVNAVVDSEGRVDLTKSGVAQTTMASVEVVKGLSGGTGNRKLLGLFRRGSSSSSSVPVPRGRSQSEDGVGLAQQSAAKHHIPESPLAFTSYRPPPRYIPSNSVLVQVWAVGIDSVDRLLVFGSNSSQGQRIQPGQLRSVSSKDLSTPPPPRPNLPSTQSGRPTPKRTASLRAAFGKLGRSDSGRSAPGALLTAETVPNLNVHAHNSGNAGAGTPPAEVGFIPGRSFVGRVLECGWEVDPEDIAKRGDWVVGLMDIKKSGALTEFVIVDRNRIHRVPHPHMEPGLAALVPSQPQPAPYQNPSRPGPSGSGSRLPTRSNSVRTVKSALAVEPLSLEELSLLPLCGLAAYRAVRTFVFAFSSTKEGLHPGINGNWGTFGSSVDAYDASPSSPENSPNGKGKGKEREGTGDRVPPRPQVKRRRALVLGGHDGAGAIAVQMLVKAGWRVCVHVPYSCLLHEAGIADISGAEHEPEVVEDGPGSSMEKDRWIELGMRRVEERVRAWGGEEVVFDDGEAIGGGEDAVIGPVVRVIDRLREDGDVFDAILDTVGGKEIWEASERLLKSIGNEPPITPVTSKINGFGKKDKNSRKASEPPPIKQFTTLVGDYPGRAIPTAGDHFRAGLRSFNFGMGGGGSDGERGSGKVGYAWVNLAQDVDWEGENVRETLRSVLRTAVQDGVRPWVGLSEEEEAVEEAGGRVLPFEKAPKAFIPGRGSLLAEGGTAVVKVAG